MEAGTAMDRDRNDDGSRRSDGISDFIKKGISTGVKSVLLTEEGVRNVITDFVPKEISASVKGHVEGLKKELYSTIVSEFTSFLEHADLAGEMRKFFSGVKIRVSTEIEFIEKPKPRRRKK